MGLVADGGVVQDYVEEMTVDLAPAAESDFVASGVSVGEAVDVIQLCSVNIFRRFTFEPPRTLISFMPPMPRGVTITAVLGQKAFPLSSYGTEGRFTLVVRSAFFLQLSDNNFITCQVDTSYAAELGKGSVCALSSPLPASTLTGVKVDPGGTSITAHLNTGRFEVSMSQHRAVKVVAAPDSVPDRVMAPFGFLRE